MSLTLRFLLEIVSDNGKATSRFRLMARVSTRSSKVCRCWSLVTTVLVFETPRSAFHLVLDQIRPHELDHASIVVAVCKIVVQGREAMLLASLLHARELTVFKFVMIDVSPIVGRSIHRKTRSHSSIGPNDHVILACAAVPLGEMKFAIFVLHNTGCSS